MIVCNLYFDKIHKICRFKHYSILFANDNNIILKYIEILHVTGELNLPSIVHSQLHYCPTHRLLQGARFNLVELALRLMDVTGFLTYDITVPRPGIMAPLSPPDI